MKTHRENGQIIEAQPSIMGYSQAGTSEPRFDQTSLGHPWEFQSGIAQRQKYKSKIPKLKQTQSRYQSIRQNPV